MLCFLSFAVLSCSNDDDNNNGKKPEIETGTETETENTDENINVLDKIKDPVFKAYIEVQIRIGGIKTDNPTILTPKEAATLKILSFTTAADKNKLVSLEGIEYFTGLEALRLNYTAVELVDLSKNLNINEIHFPGCIAESIKIISPTVTYINGSQSKNDSVEFQTPRLIKIDCSTSRLTSLNVSACPLLEYLDCGATHIISLDTSKNPELKLLRCGGFGTISCGQLDVSTNQKLELLSCNQGAGSISKLYVWWEGGRENVPVQLQGSDPRYGTKFVVNTTTQIIKK